MMKKFFAFCLSFVFLFSIGSLVVLAQVCSDGSPAPAGDINRCPDRDTADPDRDTAPSIRVSLENPFRVGDTIPELFEAIINNILLPIGGVLAVLAFIFSGFTYVTAQGNPAKLEKANRALLYTAIGTAILLGAWVIARVIGSTINQLQT